MTCLRSKVISPDLSDNEKDKILVVLSLFLRVLLIFFCSLEAMKPTDRSYCFPRIASLMETKGKRGSLPFVLFKIEQFKVAILSHSNGALLSEL